MATIETIFKISAAVTGGNAVKSLGDEIRKVSSTSENMRRSFAQMGTVLKGFAAGLGVRAIANFVQSGIDLADNLNDISQRTGVAVEALAKYKVAADNSGTSIDSVAGALGKLNKNLVDAQKGTGNAAAAFRAMGINIKDSQGNLKNADTVLLEMADRFQTFPDGPQKAALAMAIFGKSGAELIPMLNMGREEMTKFGLAIDQDLASRADAFNDQVGLLKKNVTNLSLNIANELLPGLTAIAEGFNENSDAANILITIVKGLETSFVGWQIIATQVMSAIGNGFASLSISADYFGQKLAALAKFDFGAYAKLNEMQGQELKNLDEQTAAELQKKMDGYRKTLQEIWNPEKREKMTRAVPQVEVNPFAKSMAAFNPGADAAAGRAADNAARKMADTIEDLKKKIATLNSDTESIRLNNVEKEKAKTLAEFEARGIKKTSEEYLALSEAIDKNTAAHRSFEAGAFESLNEYLSNATNTAEQTKKVFDDAFKGMEDAFVNFVTTGKLSFSDLASSIIKDLARILVQRTITGPLSQALMGAIGGGGGGGFFSGVRSFFGFANGGIMTSAGALPLNTYATGGIANSPQLAMFGEGRTPEAYVPLPDGRTIPVTMRGGGSSQNNVTVNVSVEGGGQSTKSDSKQGAELGNLIASSVKSILINEKRPGGLLAS